MSNDTTYLERYTAAWSDDSIHLFLTPSAFTKATYFYAQEIGYFKTDDRYYTERKNLNSFLIVYTISGEGRLTYEQNTYSLLPGSCFFINCMNYHHYQTVSEKNWDILWLHFNGSSALGYYEEFTRNGFQTTNPTYAEPIEQTLYEILSLNQTKTITTDILTANLITRLLTELLMQSFESLRKPLDNQIPYTPQKLQMPDYIKTTLHELNHNFRSPQSLDQLARLSGISKFHLAREFKKYTGTTINEYLITTRLSYAKELLKYSSMPVSEIAYSCGINQISHFIHLFKSREAKTPLAYRKEWQ